VIILLYCGIDTMLPKELSVQNKTVYLIETWLFGNSSVSEISVRVGKNDYEASDKNIYRPDVLALYSQHDPNLNSLFSGFRIPVVIQPVREMQVDKITLHVKFKNGEIFQRELGKLKLIPWEKKKLDIKVPSHIDQNNLMVICMATYNPNKEQFQKQIQSIKDQEFKNWICIISDDNSKEEYKEHLYEILRGDNRFILVENKENKGFYHNFERCLELVPDQAKYVALADQDDFWYPNKLNESVNRLIENEEAKLVYSDMKIVNEKGKVLSETYWKNRKNYYKQEDIDLLTIANTVTGAASVMKAELLQDVLPFPPRYGDVYHDQWIAILASAKGGIEYIDKPLYEYVQSGQNVIGHFDFGEKTLFHSVKEQEGYQRIQSIIKNKQRSLFSKLKQMVKELYRSSVSLYVFKHKNAQHITTLMENAVLRGIDEKYQKVILRPQSISGLRKVTRKVKKNRETLNNLEKILLLSLLMNRFTEKFVFPSRKLTRRVTQWLNKTHVQSISQAVPEQQEKPDQKQEIQVDRNIVEYKRKFSGRRFIVSNDRSKKVNLLISLVDPKNFFGGYIGMYNFAKKFNELGYQVRIIMTDQEGLSRENLEKVKDHDKSLKEFLSDVEFQPCISAKQEVHVSENDIFIATSWWTAYIANEAIKKTVYNKFIYLAQDYEPIFYEHGGYRALADNSYKLNYYPFFSTDILQKYFVDSNIVSEKNKGAFFKNPILQFDLSEEKYMQERKRKKRLLFYARPQAHNARNLYPIGCLAIDRARELGGISEDEWEVIAVGGDIGEQILPSGIKIKHIGKFNLDEYKELLPQHDLGLALMDSPHPSLLPIEMASAGLLVVTNTYGIKNAEYFKGISSNIEATPPHIESLASSLLKLSKEVDDYKERIRGSKVNWPHNWDEAIPLSKLTEAINEVTKDSKLGTMNE
jgi:glycosyltransferase involved in cell wall biosynthesis